MASSSPAHGHRERLRQRFAADRASFTETDLLELLLTYAVPQRDVAGTARLLIKHFGTLSSVLKASAAELVNLDGVGERTVVLLQLVAEIWRCTTGATPLQPSLLDDTPVNLDSDSHRPANQQDEMTERVVEEDSEAAGGDLRAFVNDEVAHSQQYLPEAYRFQTFDDFHAFLCERLPYNAATTRRRRANHIVSRFFPNRTLDSPLVDFLREVSAQDGRNAAIFYHVLRAELLAAKVAEELVWPALARGQVSREEVRAFVLRYLPDLSKSSQANTLRSLFTVYDRLSVAVADGELLRIRLHAGDLDGFAYVLSAEFPTHGIYRFEELEQGPMRKWLLWDREWIRRQLYLLRDLGIIAKVSEIDAIRQFTLRYDQKESLQAYYALDKRAVEVLKEGSDEPTR